ncbi:MAG TPA: hypothetical protein G4N95_04885 [Anaerolineae bacterium]|nr:hypothetical protein [Anaerolineae bacterium]
MKCSRPPRSRYSNPNPAFQKAMVETASLRYTPLAVTTFTVIANPARDEAISRIAFWRDGVCAGVDEDFSVASAPSN